MAIIVSSRKDPTFRYYNNLAFLRNELQNEIIHFQGFVNSVELTFPVTAGRIYDFTRTAKAQVREDMTTYLCGHTVLPGLQQQDRQSIREAFDCLFDYHTYKGHLDMVRQQRRESLNMLVFDHNQGYVAHVQFNSTTKREAADHYTVNATLTCLRFTYFELQEEGLEDVLEALQNLHVA